MVMLECHNNGDVMIIYIYIYIGLQVYSVPLSVGRDIRYGILILGWYQSTGLPAQILVLREKFWLGLLCWDERVRHRHTRCVEPLLTLAEGSYLESLELCRPKFTPLLANEQSEVVPTSERADDTNRSKMLSSV